MQAAEQEIPQIMFNPELIANLMKTQPGLALAVASPEDLEAMGAQLAMAEQPAGIAVEEAEAAFDEAMGTAGQGAYTPPADAPPQLPPPTPEAKPETDWTKIAMIGAGVALGLGGIIFAYNAFK